MIILLLKQGDSLINTGSPEVMNARSVTAQSYDGTGWMVLWSLKFQVSQCPCDHVITLCLLPTSHKQSHWRSSQESHKFVLPLFSHEASQQSIRSQEFSCLYSIAYVFPQHFPPPMVLLACPCSVTTACSTPTSHSTPLTPLLLVLELTPLLAWQSVWSINQSE